MTLEQGDSGLARPDLMPIADPFMRDIYDPTNRRRTRYAGLFVTGRIPLDNAGKSAVGGIDRAEAPGDDDAQFERAPVSPDPPLSEPAKYSEIEFDPRDIGPEVQWIVDSDLPSMLRKAGGEAAVERHFMLIALRRMAEGVTRKLHKIINTPANPYDAAEVDCASDPWDGSSTKIATQLDTAVGRLKFDPDGVYIPWDVWRAFKLAGEITTNFGGTAGLGSLTDAQARAAMANITGCDPELVIVGPQSAQFGNADNVHLISLGRGEPFPNAFEESCSYVLGWVPDDGTAQLPSDIEMMGSPLQGVRIMSRSHGYKGRGIWAYVRGDIGLVKASAVRLINTKT